MSYRYLHAITWVIGLVGVSVIVWRFQPGNLTGLLRSVGVSGVVVWLLFTMCARLLLVEATVIPIRVLGFPLRKSDAFWIGWIRTFSNQILPLSGLAFYAQEIRRRAGMPWSKLASLSTPQFFLAAAPLGIVGILATLCNLTVMGEAAVPMTLAFTALSAGAILAAIKSAWLIEALPHSLSSRAKDSAASFRQLARHPGLIPKLMSIHCATIVLRGCRIWMLFAAVGVELKWQEALLILVIAESATLFQITPGGLGLREGAIVGAAALLQISPDLAAGVALLDRILIIATTTIMAVPALVLIRRSQKVQEMLQ